VWRRFCGDGEVVHRRKEFFGDYRMQSKLRTSETLRQSKICLAVATMLAAMSMPAQAEAVIESEAATWSDEKKSVAKRMNERLAKIQSESEAKDEIFERVDALRSVRSSIHSSTKDIADALAYGDKLAEISGQIDHVIGELEKDGGTALTFEWERKLQVADLLVVKQQIQKAIDADPDDRADARKQLDVFLNDNAEYLKSTDAALDAQAKLAAHKTRIDALGKADEAAFNVMVNTKELVAPKQSGASTVLTWRDDNLFNSHFDEGYAEGNVQIGKETVLDITKRSGAASDAMIGAKDGVRDVGTIRAAKDVSHLVSVIDGDLNVHQGLEGEGELAVAVGNGGVLNFVEGGKGIDSAAQRVVLMAGSGASAAEVVERSLKAGAEQAEMDANDLTGLIIFGAGTSAQNAAIAVGAGAKLEFEEGSSAGASTIMVNGGAVRFETANAGSASIQNSGTLLADRASMGTSTVINHALGQFSASDTRLEQMHLTNLGTVDIDDSFGGNAFISNADEAELWIADSDLQNLTLSNAGDVSILDSNGGNATIRNDENAVLAFVDTKLEALQLESRGEVSARGRTTADNARIRLEGGSFDVSSVGELSEDGARPGDITIGSLSGRGDLIAGETFVTLGTLNLDDVFEGRILDDWEDSLDASKRLRTQPAALDKAQDSLDDNDGVRLTKVGSGNLTFTADQSDVTSIVVQGGTLTAAHASALGSGTVSVGSASTVALKTDVSGVTRLQNDGTVDLGMSKLEVGTYASEAGAKIKSRIEKVEGEVAGGQIHVTQSGDFSNTKLDVSVANDIEIHDILNKFKVVNAEGDAQVTGGELTVGSITGGKKPDPRPDPNVDPGNETKITDANIVNFLAANGGYTANEQAVLASVDGVAVGDLASGKIGGKVLSAMALQTAGSDEQRRSARQLSGESLVNNAVAAQAAATSFQRGMQTRMIAGGSMFDDKTTTGAMVSDNGIAGWASFNGGTSSQRGDGMKFDVKGLDGAIGVDKRVGQNTLVGGSLGFGNQESKAKGLPGESKVNSVSVGVYGSHLTDTSWFVNGAASYTNHSVKTDRTVAARNASSRLTGKTSGQTFGLFGEVGKRFEVSGVNIDPSVGVRVASTRLNAFDETNRDGQGNDGLKVGSQSQTSTRGVIGVRLWSEVASVAGGKIAPSLRLSYEHEFGKTQSSLTNAIYGASSGFTVKGPKLGKDIFTADLGLDMQLKKQLEVRVGGNVSVRKGESALGGGISAKYRF
jgi:uncharacterized protein with beta-barrel porin domain/uncharacterized coiled-coil DUF342 family protein